VVELNKEKPAELTLKQQRFAAEYCIDLNATAAYSRAGYAARGNSAEAAASRLLSNVKVQQAIQERERKLISRCEATTENLLREASALAFSDIRKLFNSDGSPKSIHELDELTAAAISSIEVAQIMSGGNVTGRVCKIKLWDKNSAQERLFKHLRLFDKGNASQQVGRNIEISFVSSEGKDKQARTDQK
jgi:phage terminase small subunit